MKNVLKLFVAIAVPAALLMAGTADAKGGKRWKGRAKRFYSKLVKMGAIDKADIDAMKTAKTAFKTCRKAASGKGACGAEKLALVKARLSLFEKAKASGKLKGKRWTRKLTRKIRKMTRKIKKLEAKLAGAPPAAAPAQ